MTRDNQRTLTSRHKSASCEKARYCQARRPDAWSGGPPTHLSGADGGLHPAYSPAKSGAVCGVPGMAPRRACTASP